MQKVVYSAAFENSKIEAFCKFIQFFDILGVSGIDLLDEIISSGRAELTRINKLAQTSKC